jgi:shikimate dehydrogenase
VGDNTDVAGVLEALEALGAEGPILLVGTGGSARAVAAAARTRGEALLVRSRRAERAREFAAWARALGVPAARADGGEPAGVVVNATPIGLNPSDPPPAPLGRLERCARALDLAYGAHSTALVRVFRDAERPVLDGRRVLLGQGAAAFERFFPGVTAPREVMAAAVDRRLEIT